VSDAKCWLQFWSHHASCQQGLSVEQFNRVVTAAKADPDPIFGVGFSAWTAGVDAPTPITAPEFAGRLWAFRGGWMFAPTRLSAKPGRASPGSTFPG
jgi:hypothetical protein